APIVSASVATTAQDREVGPFDPVTLAGLFVKRTDSMPFGPLTCLEPAIVCGHQLVTQEAAAKGGDANQLDDEAHHRFVRGQDGAASRSSRLAARSRALVASLLSVVLCGHSVSRPLCPPWVGSTTTTLPDHFEHFLG